MRVYYFNLAKILRSFISLVILTSTALLFSMMVKQHIPSTVSVTGKVISQVQTKEKAMALTFDVNPGTQAKVAPVIRALEEQQSKATFFINPEWARKNSDLVRQIALKGHETGILLDTGHKKNVNLPKYMEETKEAFWKLTGSAPSLVRFKEPAPGTALLDTVYSLGYKIIGSDKTINSLDEKNREWLQPGAIIFIPLEGKTDYTEKLVAKMVVTLKKQHYYLATLSELLSYGPAITN